MKTQIKIEYGTAARRNRGKFAGKKIHKLYCSYIVGLDEGEEVRPGTFQAEFKETGKPVLYSCFPVCGCTQGQHAGKPYPNLTEDKVTCSKCK